MIFANLQNRSEVPLYYCTTTHPRIIHSDTAAKLLELSGVRVCFKELFHMSELLCCLRDICGHARKLSAVARALMPACVFNIMPCVMMMMV